MPIVMRMDWPEVTAEQYEQVRETVGWEQDVPQGAIFHVAFFDESGFHVVDVWENAEDFEAFGENRLNPGIAQVGGVEGEPKVQITPATAVFNPQALAADAA
jgi:hypothetical protein